MIWLDVYWPSPSYRILWVHAMSTVVRVRNFFPTSSNEKHFSPIKLLYAKPSKPSYLHIIRCLAFYLNRSCRQKLYPIDKKSDLFGYQEETQAFLLINLETGQVVQARSGDTNAQLYVHNYKRTIVKEGLPKERKWISRCSVYENWVLKRHCGLIKAHSQANNVGYPKYCDSNLPFHEESGQSPLFVPKSVIWYLKGNKDLAPCYTKNADGVKLDWGCWW